ncbi:MAG: MATE family efflux transporter [Gammaproteobacteria bacterium]|nr:MATE family efflux transporter [Gammaproteobacteria bacterium]MDH5311528.1 MATE family efflux transporter [Gammaproteobacteria bacterium]
MGEANALLKLAGPLVINNLSIAGMHFSDAVMAGRLGAAELAAVAVGGSVWFLGLTLCLGLMMAISPIASRLHGARQPEMIGRYTRQGLWLAVVIGILFIALMHVLAEPLLVFVGVAVEFRDMTVGYAEAIVWGAPGIVAFFAFRFTTEGIGHTRPIMYTSLLGLSANVFFNYVFMFGHFGAPAMGAVGCGVASAITMWLMMMVLGSYIYLHPRYEPLEIFRRVSSLRLPVLKEIFVLGMPIAVTITAEAGLFSAVSILVGTRGPDITAAHQIALNFASTMFMIPLAFSSATTIRIGHALGAGDPRGARFAGFTGILICAGFMAISALFLLVFRDAVVSMYTSDTSVQAIAISMLLMAAIFQVADGVQIGAAGALRGFKDTRMPMVINMFAYWALAFPLSYLAAVTFQSPPSHIWGGFVIGLTAAAAMLTVRFNRVSRIDHETRQELASL